MCYRHVGPTDLKSRLLQKRFHRLDGYNPENLVNLVNPASEIGVARDRPAPYGKGARFIWRGTGPRPTVRGRDLSLARDRPAPYVARARFVWRETLSCRNCLLQDLLNVTIQV